ncbi:MAG: glutathione S-transferase family protein [SAR324 cluster bacterium]|nr:glutathione S-transferase family protein [SAR324 cluster bacterium]
MIKFYQLPAIEGVSSGSPFCMKLETYLKLAHIPYERLEHPKYLRLAPKGKMPFIEHNGVRMGDSGFIIEYLWKTFGNPLDSELSASEIALGIAIRRMVEENLYWSVVYSRWIDARYWNDFKKMAFGELPPVLRDLLPEYLKRKVTQALHGHGIGRHTEEEIYDIGKADLTALSDLLSSKKFFNGTQPGTLDATTYAFLAGILYVPLETPLQKHLKTKKNLVNYCQRMKTLLNKL